MSLWIMICGCGAPETPAASSGTETDAGGPRMSSPPRAVPPGEFPTSTVDCNVPMARFLDDRWVTSFAFDETHLYFGDVPSRHAMPAQWAIARVPRTGGAVERLVDGHYAESLRVDESAMYWLDLDRPERPDSIQAAAKDGTSVRTLASFGAMSTIFSFTMDTDSVYVGGYGMAWNTGFVVRVPKRGGDPVMLVESLRGIPTDLVLERDGRIADGNDPRPIVQTDSD